MVFQWKLCENILGNGKLFKMTAKEKFYHVYANVPLNLREEIILVIDDEPISWKVAKLEVDGETELSKKILVKLEALGVI